MPANKDYWLQRDKWEPADSSQTKQNIYLYVAGAILLCRAQTAWRQNQDMSSGRDGVHLVLGCSKMRGTGLCYVLIKGVSDKHCILSFCK